MTRPIGIVERRVWRTSKRRITHRAETIIAISKIMASMSRAVMRPNRGTAQSSRIGPKTHPRADEQEVNQPSLERTHSRTLARSDG